MTDARRADADLRLDVRRDGWARPASAGWQLATAESSTGGLIGHAITMIAARQRLLPRRRDQLLEPRQGGGARRRLAS